MVLVVAYLRFQDHKVKSKERGVELRPQRESDRLGEQLHQNSLPLPRNFHSKESFVLGNGALHLHKPFYPLKGVIFGHGVEGNLLFVEFKGISSSFRAADRSALRVISA